MFDITNPLDSNNRKHVSRVFCVLRGTSFARRSGRKNSSELNTPSLSKFKDTQNETAAAVLNLKDRTAWKKKHCGGNATLSFSFVAAVIASKIAIIENSIAKIYFIAEKSTPDLDDVVLHC